MRGDTRDRKQAKTPEAVRVRARSEDAKAAKKHAAHALDQRTHIQQTRVADGEGIEKASARGKSQKKRPAAVKRRATAKPKGKRSK